MRLTSPLVKEPIRGAHIGEAKLALPPPTYYILSGWDFSLSGYSRVPTAGSFLSAAVARNQPFTSCSASLMFSKTLVKNNEWLSGSVPAKCLENGWCPALAVAESSNGRFTQWQRHVGDVADIRGWTEHCLFLATASLSAVVKTVVQQCFKTAVYVIAATFFVLVLSVIGLEVRWIGTWLC